MRIAKKAILYLILLFLLGFIKQDNGWGESLHAVSVIRLPDLATGTVGVGFTCTGLAYDAKENVFWVGNCGKETPDDQTFHATIVKMKSDWSAVLDEILLYQIFPDMSDVQGVAYDSSDDTLWFCSFAENLVRHITKEGTPIDQFYVKNPTGIAYDQSTDSLWVLTYSSLIHSDTIGNLLSSMKLQIKGQDQLFLDTSNQIIYMSAGVDQTGTAYIYKIDTNTNSFLLLYHLLDTQAIEGICLQEKTLFVLNDGYYHRSKVQKNELMLYNIS